MRESIRSRVEYEWEKNCSESLFSFALNKYPISRAVNRQTIIAPGTLDYIRVQNKLCSP